MKTASMPKPLPAARASPEILRRILLYMSELSIACWIWKPLVCGRFRLPLTRTSFIGRETSCSTQQEPRNRGALVQPGKRNDYSTMICVGCDPFATATAHVGNPEDGNGVFCTWLNPPLCGSSFSAETVLARLFE